MQVVVVESPAKAKTINKYLGSGYQVLASYGHVRDLASKDGSVRPDDDFAMAWVVDPKAAKRLKEIADAVKGSDGLILATDPDREGEAISWHVLEALAASRALKGVDVKRVVFNAITKSAVLEAMKAPRMVNQELVEAYLARRALDYLVGFTLSPVLWRKLPGARSAGRVQSVALRLVTEREMEIERFISEEYWTLSARVTAERAEPFTADLIIHEGKKLKKLDLKTAADAERARRAVETSRFRIASVESKPVKRHPAPPFRTATLQQEAARKLGFSAQRTMQVAQKLYEGVDMGGETVGLITYMRTDGVTMAGEAVGQARALIGERHGPRYVPDVPRAYSTKAKNAQEAHEAIRPTSFRRLPDQLPVDGDMRALYALIWRRAVASQMASAELERTTIDVLSADEKTGLRAVGSVVTFDGFLAVYQEGRDDAEDEDGARLPKVAAGASAGVDQVKPEQHFTQPPPRYTEASLVKKLEELGIGRPSTYASILSVLVEREYVRLEQKRFIPEDKGRIVTAFLEKYFARYVEYDFTAGLEEKLDKVSAGELSWKELLRDFWRDFVATADGIKELRVADVLEALNEALSPHIFPPKEDGADPRACPSCADGRLSLKLGRYGAFIGCSNYPDCRHTRQFGDQVSGAEPPEDRILGQDPKTGLAVALKTGRFGPYVQLGEGETPKRAGLPKGWAPDEMSLESALKLLALPREVGPHPEDGVLILAGIGRYGPYVQHAKTYASLPNVDEVWDVGVNRAVALIADKKSGAGRRGGAALKPLRELGAHPQTGLPVNVFNGRFGPFVKHDKTNASLRKGMAVETVTLDQAVALIAERDAKGPSKGGRGGKAKAAAKPKAKARPKAKPKAKAAAKKSDAPAKRKREPVE